MDLISILIMLSFVLRGILAKDIYSPSVQPANFSGEDTPFNIRSRANTSVSAFLYGYIGCKEFPDPQAKFKIDEAYLDAFLLSRAPGIGSGIDWNNAAALDYLGAPGYNFDKQPEIQAVLANAAAIISTTADIPQQYIKVRCDDPAKLCQNSPGQNSCQPSQTDSNPPAKSQTPAAYASPRDVNDPDYPMINLCQDFFNAKSLTTAIESATSLGYPTKLNMGLYVNRAHVIFHEILHLYESDKFPRPRDVQIDFQSGVSLVPTTATAYGPTRAKILARWPGGPLLGGTGYWVQRNSDNLAYYALAQYLTSLNSELYPSYPLVVSGNLKPPHLPSRRFVAQFSKVNGSLVLGADGNGEELVAELFDGADDTCFNLGEFDDGTTPDLAVTIDDLVPDSAYPEEYQEKVSVLINSLAEDSSTAPSLSFTPADKTAPPASPPALSRRFRRMSRAFGERAKSVRKTIRGNVVF